MKIYGRTTSFNVQKVMWLVEELALRYEQIELGGRFRGLDTEAFALLNPLKKVPVLVDGDKSIWESHTILRYLIASYGDKNWYPEFPYERSLYERWLDWSQVIFQPAFMGVFWGYYRMAPDKRNMAVVNAQLEKCHHCLQIISQQLSKTSFLAGDSIALADIPIGAIIYRLTEQGLDISLPSHVERWYQTLKQRYGYKKWVMSDFSELRAREDF
ncbi:MAG: glutathione S-transferase family protein [Deltaproteobacteria bacterium]|nr:glutathione S-transferase family protein [Deltaproteobacteria bacterium]